MHRFVDSAKLLMIRKLLYKAFGAVAEGKIRKLVAASHEPRIAQQEKLLGILRKNSDCEIGRTHNFSKISSVEEYRAALPVRTYSDFQPYIDRIAAGEKQVLTNDPPLMFATTSGTTGSPKYIPITAGYMEEFRLASVVSGYHLLKSFPGMADGITMSIVSPAEEGRTSAGIPYGAISGQLFKHEPYLIKKYISPIPYEVFLLRDYETRYYILLRLALVLPLSCFYTLNPSTIALLCRRLHRYGPQLIRDIRDGKASPPGALSAEANKAISPFLKPDLQRAKELERLLDADQFVPAKIWPTLQVISCWTKAAASFYLADFPQYFGSIPICDITYGASEGRGTVFMGPGKQMLALQSHFFEFIPEAEMDSPNPSVLLADELQEGSNYFILFTTSGGLYRYNINDVVKVVGFYNRTPLLEFQYKGGNVCSFTGEKITELQVTAAMTRAARKLDVDVRFFTVIPKFRPEPHYELWIEPATDAVRKSGNSKVLLEQFDRVFDEELSIENIEYKVKRDSQRLQTVESKLIKVGSYESFRYQLTKSGVADAQIKVSHLNPKADSAEFFAKHLVPTESQQLEASGARGGL